MKRIWIALLGMVFLLSACSPARSVAPVPGETQRNAITGADMSKGVSAPAYEGVESASLVVPSESAADRLVIRNADLRIVVDDPVSALDEISQMAEKMGGFVVQSNLYKTQTEEGVETPEASITIRVPAERLNDALAQIKSLVKDKNTDILSENVSGQDVTKEYTDLKSRLTNLENTEKQLQRIMEEATKTEDVLAVYNQLVSVREQIEVLKGQIKYYEESAALSMISVTLKASATVKPLTIGKWQPIGVARDALQATLKTYKFLANAAIWIVLYFIPVAVVIILPIWLIIQGLRHLSQRKPKPAQPKPSQSDESLKG